MSKALRIFDYLKDGKAVFRGDREEIAEFLKVNPKTVHRWIKEGHDIHHFRFVGEQLQSYEFYFEGQFVLKGSYGEIEDTGILTRNQMDFIRRKTIKNSDLPTRIKKIEGETVIVKRTHNAKFAPVYEDAEVEEKKKTKVKKISVAIDKPLETKNWTMNDYHKHLFDQCFRNWRA